MQRLVSTAFGGRLPPCLLQWPFDRRSVAVAALLPSYLVQYAVLVPDQPVTITVATGRCR